MKTAIIEWQYIVYIVHAPLTVMLAVGTLLYARHYRHSVPQDTTSLQRLVVCLVGWVIFNTFELLAPSETATYFWARATWLFIAATPVAWFVFAVEWTGRQSWLTPARLASLIALPVGVFLLALTNHWHGWIWREYQFETAVWLSPMRVGAYGPAFIVWAVYAYSLVATGSLLMLRHASSPLDLFRRQSRLMVVGSMIPLVFNLVYLLHLVPGLTKDYTPFGFLMATILFAIGIMRYRLFQVQPIARDKVIDTLQDPVFTVDTAGRLVDLNQAAARLLGFGTAGQAARRLIGQPVHEALNGHGDLAQALVGNTEPQRILTTLDTPTGPSRAGHAGDTRTSTHQDGRYYDCHTLPLADPRGRPAGKVLVLHDVTPAMQAQAELQRRAEALEARNQELDAFAATVAHDLKNPLSVIQSYTELLTEDDAGLSPCDQQTFLRAIAHSTDWMAHIINEILLLARVRQGPDVPLVSLEMELIVLDAIEQLEPQIRHTQARVAIAAGWPAVLGHAPWVTGVWINYLSNALKYGGRPDLDQPPRVQLGFDVGPTSPTIRFWVRDQGPGITPEKQARLFVEFCRLPENERTMRGHGLGLSIVQRIVHTLGGEVGVESTPGEGSTFWFTLPRAPVTDASPGSSETRPLRP